MKIEVARHAIRAGLRSGRELEALLGALKVDTEPEEYREHARAIAHAIHTIQDATLSRAFSFHPQLEAEMETEIAKYGRYL